MLRLARTDAGILLAAATLLAVDVDAQTPLTAADRRAVLLGTADLIEDRYVIEDTARVLADQLRRDATADRWRDKSDPVAFAAAITAHLRSASGDGHLGLSYRATPLTGEVVAAERTYAAEEMDRWYGPHLNYGFEQVRRFGGNVGYLDLRVFAPTSTAGDVAAAVMTVLAQSAALIIDLRENGGGHGDMGHLLAAYFWTNRTDERWLRPSERYPRVGAHSCLGAGPSVWYRAPRLCADL